ncbi:MULTISPECIES: hypothetical protein [Phenylobacterium]|uniref:Lipoprotein n=1 Tax=Phenylobacterium koreense TaxID=266125 RepID=A0ABV2ELJ0_9CAUL
MKLSLIVAGVATLALTAACDRRPEPTGETTGAAMPDTSQPTMVPGPSKIGAPDAGDTGVVPADGSAAPVQPTPPVQQSPPAPAAK